MSGDTCSIKDHGCETSILNILWWFTILNIMYEEYTVSLEAADRMKNGHQNWNITQIFKQMFDKWTRFLHSSDSM